MLRRPSERKLVNVIDSNTIVESGDYVIIAGFTIPKTALDVISNSKKCLIYCNKDCVPKEITVTIALPAESCGCIEEWAIKIVEPIQGKYDLHDIRPLERVYVYDVPVGVTPTELMIAADIVAQINADKTANYTATDNVDNTFTITSKDGKCRDFNVYFPTGMATQVTDIAFERAVLSAEEMSKMFPIGHNSFASRPDLPLCGSYCKYVIKFSAWTQDLAHSLGQLAYQHDVEFYVRNDVPEFQTLWANKLEQYMNCCSCDFTLAATGHASATATITGTDCDSADVVSYSWAVDDNDVTIAGGTTATATFTNAEAGDVATLTITFIGCGPLTKSVTLT